MLSIKMHVLQKQIKNKFRKGKIHWFPPRISLLPLAPVLCLPPKSSLAQEGFALVSLRTRYRGNRISGVQLRTGFGSQNLSYWSCNVWWKDPSLTLTDCIGLSKLAAKQIKILFIVTWEHLIRIDWDTIHTGSQSITLRISFCSNRTMFQRSIWGL